MIKDVLSLRGTSLSGSLRLVSGPTERAVRLGIAAANIRVNQTQIATFLDRVSLNKPVRRGISRGQYTDKSESEKLTEPA
jgi:hypothetical protein